jgi:demethoxyubiquinone hydroxylase (CLK1/Coq7/Cat5 family)
MSDWSGIQSTVLAILAVTTTITTALVGLQIGTVRTLRESNRDLRDRVTDLEKERLEDRAANGKLTSENQLLKAMVTGKVEWIAVTDQIEAHAREALDHWRETEAKLTEILAAVREAP